MSEVALSGPTCRAIEQISARELTDAVREGFPFVVRGHTLVRRLASRTTLPGLARRFAGKEIEVEKKHRWVAQSQRLEAGAYLSNIEESEYYWRHFLLQSFDMKVSLPKPSARYGLYFDYGWIGPKDTVQTFHQDNHDDVFVNHNLFVQVIGQKYVAIASPADSTWFHSLPLQEGDVRHSRASPRDRSTQRNCSSLAETILSPGDILYIPPRYWHFMQSTSASMSISRWWFDSRIAEIIYASAIGIRGPNPEPVNDKDWIGDLVHFGGITVINELLKKKPPLIQLQITIALTRFYGKGILNGQV